MYSLPLSNSKARSKRVETDFWRKRKQYNPTHSSRYVSNQPRSPLWSLNPHQRTTTSKPNPVRFTGLVGLFWLFVKWKHEILFKWGAFTVLTNFRDFNLLGRFQNFNLPGRFQIFNLPRRFQISIYRTHSRFQFTGRFQIFNLPDAF